MIFNIFVHSHPAGVKQRFRLIGTRFLSMALLVVTLPGLAAPIKTQNARQQIDTEVQRQANDVISQEAARRQWSNYQVKLNLSIPSEVAQLPPCGNTPSASLLGGERIDVSRLRFDVRCEEGQDWNITVTVKPDISVPVVVAGHDLERGQVISQGDVSLKKLNISNASNNYVSQPDEVIGLTVKRRIRELQPISLNQLESPVLVERGQNVVMIAEQDGVEARTMGEAMKKGRKGEIIKVKNTSSERIVSAVVTDSGVVRMVGSAGR